jgi:hypothetical protein
MRYRSSSAVQNGQESFGREEGAKGSGLSETLSYVCCVVDLYEHSRTHLALAKDAPEPRAVEKAEQGPVIAIPQVGGLHHRYQRQAA